jgi:hypothetical protein
MVDVVMIEEWDVIIEVMVAKVLVVDVVAIHGIVIVMIMVDVIKDVVAVKMVISISSQLLKTLLLTRAIIKQRKSKT